MKMFEKLILCCVWICIAIVMVLIKDQVDLNKKIDENIKENENPTVQRQQNQIILDEEAVEDFLVQNIYIIDQVDIQFIEGEMIELRLIVTEQMIEEIKNALNYEVIDMILPALKDTEIICTARLNTSGVEVIACQAGLLNMPQAVLDIMNEKINEMLKNHMDSKGITEVKVSTDGVAVSLQQE